MDSQAMQIAREILPQLKPLLSGWRSDWFLDPLIAAPLTADATSKVVVRSRDGESQAILLCSNPSAPGMVAHSLAAAARAQMLLQEEAGKVVLGPLLCGESHGLTFAVFPWRQLLGSNRLLWPLQKRWLAPPLFQWLRTMNEVTRRDASPADIEEKFVAPLQDIADAPDLSRAICAAAVNAISSLREGRWEPKLVLAHNDLWRENILVGQSSLWSLWKGRVDFAVIDWAGSREQGHAFYDLVRLADSLRLEGKPWSREIHKHCRILDCAPIDACGYLLASLGTLGLQPGCFTRDRFVRLANNCCRKLFPAVNESAEQGTQTLELEHAANS